MAGRGGTRSLDSSSAETQPVATFTPGEHIDGVYRIERLLGEGGGGAVYLVQHEGLHGARFALKVLHELSGRSADTLAREGRLAAEVRSAHVVKVASIGRLPTGAPYLVMEYVEGPTLDGLLADRDLITSEAIDCGRQLCLALEAAHGQGLLHGDVSLRNVFVTTKPDGSLHVQLGDFGLARRIRRAASTTISIDVGTGRGTPRFMAPEVISGDELDERSDVFSVGVVLYRLLSGAYPFDGESAREILTATLRGGPVPLSHRRAGLSALAPVVMRCLSADPAERYRNARELRESLEAARSAGPNTVSPLASAQRTARPSARRNGLGVIAIAASALLLWASLRIWREHARIPIGDALICPDTAVAAADADLARALAQATCARIGAALDLDWGGAPAATQISTRLSREPDGAYRLDLEVAGRVETAQGDTPLATAIEAARRLLARVDRKEMSAADMRLWGAPDAKTAEAVRAVWRRRTVIILDNAEEEPRAVLAENPDLPLLQGLLAEVERDPIRRREARQKALANADRLSPDRAEALRGFLAVDEDASSADQGLELLRRAYSSSPSDLDVGVLYAGALVAAQRSETALAVIEQLHARFPRRALLAVHYGTNLPQRTPEDNAQLIAWMLEGLPESRGWTDNICRLTETGHLAEAEAASDFARRFGIPDERRLIPDALLALAVGDPARIERTSVRLQGSTLSWALRVGARMRLAALLLMGQVAAAESFLETQIATHRTAGDEVTALYDATELLRISRRTGGPSLPPAELDWMTESLTRLHLPLSAFAAARTELGFARAHAHAHDEMAMSVARADLNALDEELARRAGADALALAAARLGTLALVRLVRGDAEAANRWRTTSAAWLDDRVRPALDAALALEATGDTAEAERAYRLAASPFSLDRHAFESIAARLRLAELLRKQGRDAEARTLLSEVDRAWSGADRGLREIVQTPR